MQLKQLDRESLVKLILLLQQQSAVQQELLQQSQEQLAKDSHSLGKPPGSEGLKKGRRKSLRRSGRRPRGGQRGHKGRTLMQVVEPEHVVVHGLAGCPHCQTELADVAVQGHLKRQIFDSASKTKPRPIGRPKQPPPKNLLDRLHRQKAGVLASMYAFRIPFDNNLVERDVRVTKVQRKVSGCFRMPDGAHIFCAIRFYISTARKHGINGIEAIYNAFIDQSFIPRTPQAQ